METLSDPSKDRAVKSVKPPPHKPLSRQLMFPPSLKNKPDWKLVRDHLQKEGRIDKPELIKLVNDVSKVFRNEANLLQVQDPLTVVGDIHGQYYDLLKILDIGGNPQNTKYLFLGDFVDRGSFSVEVLILLYSLKICYPETILMLRGNHECRQMTTFFNFRAECLYKYDQEIYDLLMDSFDVMPLSCIVNGKFIAVHGGISPDLKTIEDLNKVDRFKEPPKSGLFCDLLWADPVDNEDGICENTFRQNDVRGCSYFYGSQAVSKFLDQNGLLSVIRAHEAQLDGYKMHKWTGGSDFPVVITIFSAPNYCDVYNNKGAVIKFENNTLNIQQYNYSPHPYLLPNFMDIFTWSIPFVAEKVTEMLYNLIKPAEYDDLEDDDDDTDEGPVLAQKITGKQTVINATTKGANIRKRSDVLRSKIKFVSKMAMMNKVLRENSEDIVKLKGMCPDSRIPQGLLQKGADGIKDTLDDFKRAKEADLTNEMRPDMQSDSGSNSTANTGKTGMAGFVGNAGKKGKKY